MCFIVIYRLGVSAALEWMLGYIVDMCDTSYSGVPVLVLVAVEEPFFVGFPLCRCFNQVKKNERIVIKNPTGITYTVVFIIRSPLQDATANFCYLERGQFKKLAIP